MIKQVYLQEKDFPQSCTECEYYTVGRVCKLFKAPVWSKCGTERDEACPLKTLEKHDREVRADFAQRLKPRLKEMVKSYAVRLSQGASVANFLVEIDSVFNELTGENGEHSTDK